MTQAIGDRAGRPLRVGFVGLGDQGGPIAQRIADSGFPLTLWARRREALVPFQVHGIATSETLEALADASDVLSICVRDDAGVDAVTMAALPSLEPGSIVVIHSTVHPDTCRRLALVAEGRGVAVIDAPVSGGGAGARAGTLAVMVGGSEVALETCRPVFESFAALIVRLGEVGAGQLAKLVNNTLMAANLELADRAAALGATLGLDPVALSKVISASSGRSFAHDTYARLPNLAAFSFGATLLRKDVKLLDETAAEAGVAANPLTSVARSFLEKVPAA